MNYSAEPPPLPTAKPALPLPRFSRLGAVLALCVIAACVGFVVYVQSSHKAGAAVAEVRPNHTLEIMARYIVGVKELLRVAKVPDEEALKASMQDMGKFSRNDEDALRVLILKGWLTDAWPAKADLDAAAKNADMQEDVATLQRLKEANGTMEEDSWKKLRQRHGWLADLARAQTLPEKDATRQAVVQQALGTAMVLMGVSMLGMAAAVGGTVLFILGIVRWRRGQLRLTLGLRNRGEGGVLLEAFAIFLVMFLFLPRLLRLVSVELPRWAAYGPALAALIFAMAWPLLRGLRRVEWREALGLHRGQGWLREMGAGMLGWLASLPLLVLGMIAASWIMKLTGEFPTHPIVEVFAGDGWAKLGAILLATVWAPISEEIMFRGMLFPGLSAWMRWLVGVLLSAFVFAVIHPQGWAGVPAIMALACSFSFLRMWRQSLIAPMTAHALNNGIMCAVMLVLF